MTNMSPIVAELERLYDQIMLKYGHTVEQTNNRAYYSNSLYHLGAEHKPMISVAGVGGAARRGRFIPGWYTPAVWEDEGEKLLASLSGVGGTTPTRAEIVLAPELMATPEDMLSELARLAVWHNKVVSAEAPRQRNKPYGSYGDYWPHQWRSWANSVEHSSFSDYHPDSGNPTGRGYEGWKPNGVFIEWAKSVINYKVFDIASTPIASKTPGATRMKKWECGCTIVRCATDLIATCDFCGEKFEWAEKVPPVNLNWLHGKWWEDVPPPGYDGRHPNIMDLDPTGGH